MVKKFNLLTKNYNYCFSTAKIGEDLLSSKPSKSGMS